jgi:hypothetical protein
VKKKQTKGMRQNVWQVPITKKKITKADFINGKIIAAKIFVRSK